MAKKPVRQVAKAGKRPVAGNVRKDGAVRTAADLRREQVAAREAYQGPSQLPGGNMGNGDLVQTPNGPVWVPHGAPMPDNVFEMRAGDTGRVSDLGQPQTNPNTNLYQYRQNGMANPDQTPDTPAPWDFPGTYDANPAQAQPVPGYNTGGDPTGSSPYSGNTVQPGAPNMGAPPGGTFDGSPNAAQPLPGTPPAPGPANPFAGSPNAAQPLALPQQPPQQSPGQLQGLLAAYGYTTGPNGELLPIHLRQGNSPFQNQPGQNQVPGYQVPGFP
jgi:hypothetical protein